MYPTLSPKECNNERKKKLDNWLKREGRKNLKTRIYLWTKYDTAYIKLLFSQEYVMLYFKWRKIYL